MEYSQDYINGFIEALRFVVSKFDEVKFNEFKDATHELNAVENKDAK